MFEDGLDFFALSYGGDMAIVGASVGGSEQSQLLLMDTKTGQLVRLTDTAGVQFGAVTWSKDDRSIYYRSNEENLRDFFIYRMDLATGKSVKVFGDSVKTRGSNSIEDLSQDGTRMVLANYRSNVDNTLFLLDLTTGQYQQLTEDTLDVMHSSITIMPDNKTLWLVCNGNADGRARLAKMKIGSPAVEFTTDGWIDPRWEIEAMSISRDFKYQSVLFNENGYSRLKVRELESRAELPSPPLEGMMGLPVFDQTGSCIVSYNDPTRAPDVWRWTPRTKELKQLTFAPYAGIDRELFAAPQLVTYRSFDSLEIPAFLFLPKDYVKGQPLPFIIDAHGGPEGQSRPYFMRNAQYLLLNGFGLLMPNVRGSDGYGREYINLDNYKNRKNSLKDYKAAAEYLIAAGYTKPGMIGIRGGSYGGYVVLGMITEYPDLFAAAMDEVGIANFVTFLQNTAAYRRALREAEYGPLTDTAFLHEISPIWKADQIKTPLLVIHGANDPRVPVGEARQIIKAILDRGGAVDSLIFADEGHGSGKRVNIIASYRKQVEFFSRFLKPAESQPARKE